MKKQEKLYQEYNKLKDKAQKDKSLNLLEDYKNKLIELDYVLNMDYEAHLEKDFPMTTTLEKEESRLEKLISYIDYKSKEQKKLINDYKKITGEAIELSYLKYTDNIKSYRERLSNVRKIIEIIDDINDAIESKNDTKTKVLTNKLIRKELLSLLYEFCLIDSLDTTEINIEKLIKNNELNEEITSFKEETFSLEIPKSDTKEIEYPKEEIKEVELKEEYHEEEEKILTIMPIVDKIGSVVPVNVFESLQKTEEKLPDVVLPSNGLKDDKNDIFVDTTQLFEEPEKEENKEIEKKDKN